MLVIVSGSLLIEGNVSARESGLSYQQYRNPWALDDPAPPLVRGIFWSEMTLSLFFALELVARVACYQARTRNR